jgi:hypothetical protein
VNNNKAVRSLGCLICKEKFCVHPVSSTVYTFLSPVREWEEKIPRLVQFARRGFMENGFVLRFQRASESLVCCQCKVDDDAADDAHFLQTNEGEKKGGGGGGGKAMQKGFPLLD